MRNLIDLHSHTTRCCHAIGTQEAYIERAIALGLRDFGISDHSHWMLHAKGQRYAMRPEEQDDYVADVRRLQERYNRDGDSPFNIRLGSSRFVSGSAWKWTSFPAVSTWPATPQDVTNGTT